MNKQENFEKELPEGYELKLHIDASNKKTTVIYMILSFVPPVITVVAAALLLIYARGWSYGDVSFEFSIALLISCIVLIAYVVLHELTHGITYKIFTGAKLTFGLKWNVAFCGVPDIFVYRKAAMFAVLMPFAVFTVVFSALTAGMYFVSPAAFFCAAFVFGMHLGGCVGDLHVTYMLLLKFKSPKTLMRDTGPEQFIYVPTGE